MSVDPRNQLNDLTAQEWIARTVSVLPQKGLGKNSQHAKYERMHPAPFSFQDVSRFIEFFTKIGQTVLDPFAGVGSTMKASALLGRRSVGIELSPYFCDLARKRLDDELPDDLLQTPEVEIIEGDVRTELDSLEDQSVHCIVTSPPYWGILDKVDHKAKQERLANGYHHNYGAEDADLSQIRDYDTFVYSLAEVFANLAPKLASKRYAVIVVGDFRNKSKYHMFHADLASAIERTEQYALKGITILYQRHKRVFPYGYPYSFVPNLHHQYVLIMQRTE